MDTDRIQDNPRLTVAGRSTQRDITVPGLCACLFSLVLLAGCSGSSSDPAPSTNGPVTGFAGSQNPGEGSSPTIHDGLQLFADETDLLRDIPDVVASETLANSGLQVAYTHVDQRSSVPALDIETQWMNMQTCLEQVAASPIVVVIEGTVAPLTALDDVIYHIDGAPIASASRGTVVIIQVRDADFDGSLGRIGFNMRSIMGRYIWLANNLAERDYPFACASSSSV